MITRIELTNFMSHTHTVIEPAAGLTVIIGPNNCGKSAIVAALQILCTNDNSTYVTRHGERESAVRVETDDGHVIEWRRKTSPRYIIDGQLFDRLKQSVPDELHAALRLAPVECENETFDIHFAAQKRPIFLLQDKPKHAAEFFASSSDACRLLEMQNLHRQRVHNRNRDKIRLEAEAATLASELTNLEPMDAVDERVRKLEVDFAALTELAEAIRATERDHHELRTAIASHRRHAAQQQATSSLSSPPELMPTAPLEHLIAGWTSASSAAARASAQVAATKQLAAPPEMHDVATLGRVGQQIVQSQRMIDRCEAARRAMSAIQPPPPQADTAGLSQLIGWLDATNANLQTAERTRVQLSRLSLPPTLESVTPLEQLLHDMHTAAQSVARRESSARLLGVLLPAPSVVDPAPLVDCLGTLEKDAAELARHSRAFVDLQTELEEVQSELRRWAEDQQVCPTCGATIDAERLLEQFAVGMGGHGHD